MCKKDEILAIFPDCMKKRMERVLVDVDNLNEIRLGVNQPFRVIHGGREVFVTKDGNLTRCMEHSWIVTQKEIDEVMKHVCSYSLYAFENEIRQGFLTVQGGHRIGLSGKVVLNEDDTVRNITYIRFMNIRISHEVLGVADEILPYVYGNGRVQNTLIVSPPGCGKTTLLRDLVRQISDGSETYPGKQVAVVDERSEIAGSYLGIPQNHIGVRTDVLDACPKSVGMMLLMRSMAPQVVAVDEVGGKKDMDSLYQIIKCGTGVLATMHGSTMEDVQAKLGDHRRMFERFVFLSRKTGHRYVKKVCDIDNQELFQEIGK